MNPTLAHDSAPPDKTAIHDPKPYPAYKDSGVAWLGKVPDHWHVSPAFASYRPWLTMNAGMTERVVLSLSYGQIIVKSADRLHGLVPESFETYQVIEPGDIIVRTTGAFVATSPPSSG